MPAAPPPPPPASQHCFFIRDPLLHWHPALLASDPTFLLRRLAVNSEEDHPIKVKLYRPSKPSYNARQPWKTINLSELGPSISNPTSLSPPTSDLVKCADITEPFILYNLISRFETDSIYTSIGDIMIAINPFRSIPNLHSDTVMDSFKNLTDVQRIEASPHVFNIASTALAGLTAHNVMQSIIISGESGAGKTEQTKKCLQFYADRSAPTDSGEAETVEDRLLSANPVLEAFGNAKTVRNNNSSRFGKWMKIRFSRSSVTNNLTMVGCHTDHYLLEKARIISHAPGERGFHVFYQILSSSDPALLDSLHLSPSSSPADFAYLAPHSDSPEPIDDHAEFSTMLNALAHLSFSPDDQQHLFQTSVGVLFLGNLAFEPSDSDADLDPPSPTPASTPSLNSAAALLGLDPDRLARALATKERTVRSEKITSVLSPAQTHQARDALAKKTYSFLFDHILHKINEAMHIPECAIEPFIGILDIFGFEIFELNSFEQLCINYCNEKLQKHFIDHVIKMEEAMYKEENLSFTPSQVIDNQDVLDLIEEKRIGLLPLLHEECRIAKSTDLSYMHKITDRFQHHHRRFEKTVHYAPLEFKIHHYAGGVSYDTTDWLERNRDELSPHLREMMLSSRFPLIQQIFSPPSATPASPAHSNSPTPAHKTHNNTEASTFMTSLDSLAMILESSRPHFIRCIKPNAAKKPSLIDADLTLEQLRYSGVLDAIAIRKQGFPFRPSHGEFWQRYWCVSPAIQAICAADNLTDPDEKTFALVMELQKLEEIFTKVEYGLTRIFYRAEQHETLEKLRATTRNGHATNVQKYRRGFVARVKARQLFEVRDNLRSFLFLRDGKHEWFTEDMLIGLQEALIEAELLGLNIKEVDDAHDLVEKLLIEAAIEAKARSLFASVDDSRTETHKLVKLMNAILEEAKQAEFSANPSVVALSSSAASLAPYAESELELLRNTQQFDKDSITLALAKVASLEQTLNRPFCSNALEQANNTIQHIIEEEKQLTSLSDLIALPTHSHMDFPLTPEQQDALISSLPDLENEVLEWEGNLPRSKQGQQLVMSARLVVDIRTALCDPEFFYDSDALPPASYLDEDDDHVEVEPIASKYDYYLSELSPDFEIAAICKPEIELISSNLSNAKFLPLIKHELQMTVSEGPVGEMDSTKLHTKRLEHYLQEATKHKIQSNPEGKLVTDQALSLLKVRQQWKKHEWDNVQSACSSTALPTNNMDLIRTEISWAKLEALDRILQREMETQLESGKMDSTGIVHYNHVEKVLASLQTRRASVFFDNDRQRGTFDAADLDPTSPTSRDSIDPDTGSPMSSPMKRSLNPQNQRSVKTLELLDTAMLTIEVRKLQEAELWDDLLKLFNPNSADSLDKAVEKTTAKRRSSALITTRLQSEGRDLRRTVSAGIGIEMDASSPKSGKGSAVMRYPKSLDTAEMRSARTDASHKLLEHVIIPALAMNGATGTIGDVDTSKLDYKELSKAIQKSQSLPLQMGPEAEELVAVSKRVLKFRRAICNAKNRDFSNCLPELISLADDPLTTTESATAAGSASSPLLSHPGFAELQLFVGQVRYLQALLDIPVILKAGLTEMDEETGELDNETWGLDLAITNIDEFPSAVNSLPVLQTLREALVCVRDVRRALEISDWSACTDVIAAATKSELISRLPDSCGTTCESELAAASTICFDSISLVRLTSALETGALDPTAVHEHAKATISYTHLDRALDWFAESTLETPTSTHYVATLKLARDLRILQRDGSGLFDPMRPGLIVEGLGCHPYDSSTLKDLIYSPRYTNPSTPHHPLFAPEFKTAQTALVNDNAIFYLEGHMSDNPISGHPGSLLITPYLNKKGQEIYGYDTRELKEALSEASMLDVTRETPVLPRTRMIMKMATFLVKLRADIMHESRHQTMTELLQNFQKDHLEFYAAMTPMPDGPTGGSPVVREEVALAEEHIRVCGVRGGIVERVEKDRIHWQRVVTYPPKYRKGEDTGSGSGIRLREKCEGGGKKGWGGKWVTKGVEEVSGLVDEGNELCECCNPGWSFKAFVRVTTWIWEVRKRLVQADYGGLRQVLEEISREETETPIYHAKAGEEIEGEAALKAVNKVWEKERLVAKFEADEYFIQHRLSEALSKGGICGEVGRVRFDELDIRSLQDAINKVDQLTPRTSWSLKLVRYARVLLKIRKALLKRPRAWGEVGEALKEAPVTNLLRLNRVLLMPSAGRLEEEPDEEVSDEEEGGEEQIWLDELELVRKERLNVQIVSTLSTALEQGWDKHSEVGELQLQRIDVDKLRASVDKVMEVKGSVQKFSDSAEELYLVALKMRDIRGCLRWAVSLKNENSAEKQKELRTVWERIRTELKDIEKMEKKEKSHEGLKISSREIYRVQQELQLYDSTTDLNHTLFKGKELHESNAICDNGSAVGPLIKELENAIESASKMRINFPALALLLKNGIYVLKIRKALYMEDWGQVESHCDKAETALGKDSANSSGMNEWARIEIESSAVEAHNQRVKSRISSYAILGMAQGGIGNLDYRDIKTGGFETAFKFAEEEKKKNLKLRPEVVQLLTWGKLVWRLRIAQKEHGGTKEGESLIEDVLREMVAEKKRNKDTVPALVEAEFELAKDDSMYRTYVGLFKKFLKNGGPVDESGGAMSNWCVFNSRAGGRGNDEENRKCNYCRARTLGHLNMDGVQVQELADLVKGTGEVDLGLAKHLTPFRETAKIICELRSGLTSDNWEVVRRVLDTVKRESSLVEGEGDTPFANMLEEGKKELRLAGLHLNNFDALNVLRNVFDKKSGSFYKIEGREDEGEQRKPKVSIFGVARRRYSMEAAGDENIDFGTVNVEEIDFALEKAQEVSQAGRSKELKQLLHTMMVIGELRKCMKSGNWPKVASIFRGLDQIKVHQLAKPELHFVEYQLKAREEQKMLLEGLKSSYAGSGSGGWVDNAGMETKQLEIAVSIVKERSAAQRRLMQLTDKHVLPGQGELNMQVTWLLKTCESIIRIRKTIAALAFDDALGLARNARRAFVGDVVDDFEWKHFVKEELDGYVVELERRKECVESVELIKNASSMCDVVGLKNALKQAEHLGLERCPELGMRGAITYGKTVLKECVGLDKRIAKCMAECDGEGLEDGLKRADTLGLVTEMTLLGRRELERLVEFRAELSNVVGRVNGSELKKIISRAKTGSTMKRIDYTAMKGWDVVEFLGTMDSSVGVYVQLELAKMNIYEEGTKSGGMVDHRHHVDKMDDVVTLTVRIKQEKVFGVKKMQKKYGNLAGWEGLRSRTEFGRTRMVYDKKKGDGMLKWSSVPIHASLVKLPENLSALAVRLFRQNMLGWCGCRVFSHPVVLLRQILVVCLKVEGVRDEVYVSIMKQLDGCGRAVRVKLWVLMKMCLGVFPPSKEFENYLEMFLIREGCRECVYALHECVTAFVLRKESGGGQTGLVGDLREVEKEVEREEEFFGKVDFEKTRAGGVKRLEALERIHSDGEWRRKWGGRGVAVGSAGLVGLLAGAEEEGGDWARVAWLVKGGGGGEVGEGDVEVYLRDIEGSVRAHPGGELALTLPSIRFGWEWFRDVVRVAKKQLHRVKSGKCGLGFGKVLHGELRERLLAAWEGKKERAEREREATAEHNSDDEVDMGLLVRKEGKVKKRGGVAVRKNEMGQVISTSVGGFNEGSEKIKLPNKFKLEDNEKVRGRGVEEKKLDGSKGAARVRFGSSSNPRAAEGEGELMDLMAGQEEGASDSDYSELSEGEESGGGRGGGGRWGLLRKKIKAGASFDIVGEDFLQEEEARQEAGEEEAGEEEAGEEGGEEEQILGVGGEEQVVMSRPRQAKKHSKSREKFQVRMSVTEAMEGIEVEGIEGM